MPATFAHSEQGVKMAVRKKRRDYIASSRYTVTMKLRIKELREKKGLTVEALAAKAGISKSYLSELTSGKKQINGARLEAIARALDCMPTDLIDDRSIEPDLLDHIKRIKELSPEDRHAVIRHAESLARKDD